MPKTAQPPLTDIDIQSLAPLFSKDYSQEAMSFLSNYHRILNYWGEGVDILPPQLGEGKRRRFSFLIWCGLGLCGSFATLEWKKKRSLS